MEKVVVVQYFIIHCENGKHVIKSVTDKDMARQYIKYKDLLPGEYDVIEGEMAIINPY